MSRWQRTQRQKEPELPPQILIKQRARAHPPGKCVCFSPGPFADTEAAPLEKQALGELSAAAQHPRVLPALPARSHPRGPREDSGASAAPLGVSARGNRAAKALPGPAMPHRDAEMEPGPKNGRRNTNAPCPAGKSFCLKLQFIKNKSPAVISLRILVERHEERG